MAAVTSLILVKQFTYRDTPGEEWSNRYYVRNPPPGDAASWRVMADDLIAAERTCYPASSAVVRAYGYNDDASNAQSVWSHDYLLAGESKPGTLPAEVNPMAGDQAGLIEWQTDRKNTRGKWIYLRKYMHDGFIEGGDKDRISEGYRLALQAFADQLSPGGGALLGGIRSRTHADGILSAPVSHWVTTRTLKRRGKRPLARA